MGSDDVAGGRPVSVGRRRFLTYLVAAPTLTVAARVLSSRATTWAKSMRIGPYDIDPPLILAPMAGVTDKPFRLLCKRLGAGYAVSEMTTADPRLWRTRKTSQRLDHEGEPAPIGVQIAGADPQVLAVAARHAALNGAQIVDDGQCRQKHLE